MQYYKVLTVITLLLLVMDGYARGVYQSNDAFLQEAFGGDEFQQKVIWQKRDVKEKVADILGHRYPGLRVRYWTDNQKTAWILDEIGKEYPITIGVLVQDGAVKKLKILAFRESRGDEVRLSFFTRQFQNISLDEQLQLSHSIDAISGATLSVHAVKNVSRLALYFDSLTHD